MSLYGDVSYVHRPKSVMDSPMVQILFYLGYCSNSTDCTIDNSVVVVIKAYVVVEVTLVIIF